VTTGIIACLNVSILIPPENIFLLNLVYQNIFKQVKKIIEKVTKKKKPQEFILNLFKLEFGK